MRIEFQTFKLKFGAIVKLLQEETIHWNYVFQCKLELLVPQVQVLQEETFNKDLF